MALRRRTSLSRDRTLNTSLPLARLDTRPNRLFRHRGPLSRSYCASARRVPARPVRPPVLNSESVMTGRPIDQLTTPAVTGNTQGWREAMPRAPPGQEPVAALHSLP